MYLPAWRIIHTGGLCTLWPLTARRRSGRSPSPCMRNSLQPSATAPHFRHGMTNAASAAVHALWLHSNIRPLRTACHQLTPCWQVRE